MDKAVPVRVQQVGRANLVALQHCVELCVIHQGLRLQARQVPLRLVVLHHHVGAPPHRGAVEHGVSQLLGRAGLQAELAREDGVEARLQLGDGVAVERLPGAPVERSAGHQQGVQPAVHAALRRRGLQAGLVELRVAHGARHLVGVPADPGGDLGDVEAGANRRRVCAVELAEHAGPVPTVESVARLLLVQQSGLLGQSREDDGQRNDLRGVRDLVDGQDAALREELGSGNEGIGQLVAVGQVVVQRDIEDVAAVPHRVALPAGDQERQPTQELDAPDPVQRRVQAQRAFDVREVVGQAEVGVFSGEYGGEQLEDIHLHTGGVGVREDLADADLRGFTVNPDHRHVVRRQPAQDLVLEGLHRGAHLRVVRVGGHINEEVVAFLPQQH